MSETFSLPCEWEENPNYSGCSLANEIQKVQYLTGLRNFTVHDVLRYTQQLHKNGIPFYISRDDFHDIFTWIRQQLGYDNDISRFPNAVSVWNILFNVFDKDEDGQITAFELAIGISVLCGGLNIDNFTTSFKLLNSGKVMKHKRRFITTKDAYDAYCTIFRLLYQLYDDILSRVGCDPDYYARALTLRAFHRHNKHHRKHQKSSNKQNGKDKKKFRSHIKVSTFIHWYKIGIEHIVCDVPMLVEDHYNGGKIEFS